MLTQINYDLLRANIEQYPKSIDQKLNYAVSGLRNKASILKCPIFRTGIIACLRSIDRNGSAIGLMITASHNPAEDNGVKIIDPKGEMLDREWVGLATELINLNDDLLESWLNDRIKKLSSNTEGQVFIARDTRDSSEQLADAASKGVLLINGQFKNFGLLTTPQLHYIVNCQNTNEAYGHPSEEGYYLKYSNAFMKLIENVNSLKYEKILNIDCANGVGSSKMNLMLGYLTRSDLKIELNNTGDGVLNLGCGADYVKIEQKSPINLQLKTGEKYASFDGDADRLVYYYLNPATNSFKLLDGDKIATLFAIYTSKILKKLNLSSGQLDVSVVQTAYANGSSTNYIEQVLGMRTHCVATGVLNLHHKASQCDIGIYFEANGHGTVLFSDRVIRILNESNDDCAKELLLFVDLINQTAGDAISDLLATEFILRKLDWSIHEWSEIYTDLPQRQLKVIVKDRTKIQITEDERKCVHPKELQQAIDSLVIKYGHNSRSFVRPSQTEDIVRVYAESSSQELANQLAEEIAQKVRTFVL